VLSAKAVAVLNALLWGFHNCQSGRCFPSYERIAEKADCARSTVYEAIRALEAAGVLSWVNRIVRIREWGPDLFGRARNRWRVIRTSNAYTFVDPGPCGRPSDSSKSELQTGTEGQESFLLARAALDLENPLHRFAKSVPHGGGGHFCLNHETASNSSSVITHLRPEYQLLRPLIHGFAGPLKIHSAGHRVQFGIVEQVTCSP
jgi:hypothetical protein